MAFTVGEREVRPLTADEVLRMVELGILDEDEPVELLHGALVRMSAKTPAHEEVKVVLNQWLTESARRGGYVVRVEASLRVPDRTSLPEPDIAVVPAARDRRSHPEWALLVIEVAVSSLRTDTRVKPALYAAAGVPELWVVEPTRQRVHIFDEPTPTGFDRVRVIGGHEHVTPQYVDVPPLSLEELFAGL
jgi:Uma2 family endonuclease